MGKQCIEAKAVVCIIVCKYETSFKMGVVHNDKKLLKQSGELHCLNSSESHTHHM